MRMCSILLQFLQLSRHVTYQCAVLCMQAHAFVCAQVVSHTHVVWTHSFWSHNWSNLQGPLFRCFAALSVLCCMSPYTADQSLQLFTLVLQKEANKRGFSINDNGEHAAWTAYSAHIAWSCTLKHLFLWNILFMSPIIKIDSKINLLWSVFAETTEWLFDLLLRALITCHYLGQVTDNQRMIKASRTGSKRLLFASANSPQSKFKVYYHNLFLFARNLTSKQLPWCCLHYIPGM